MTTVGAAIRSVAARLAGTCADPWRDAERLVGTLAGVSRPMLLADPGRSLAPEQLAALEELARERATGVPLAYLLGTCDFWSLTLRVTAAVLVPRPETELLVERALHHLPADGETSVLDLGTGSGAIALSVASERPEARVTGVDVSTDALVVARDNATRLRLAVRWLCGDWFAPLQHERFTLIASNPPYVAPGDPDLDPEVRIHEPAVALFADRNGLACLERLAMEAPRHLHPGGWLVLEHGWRQGAAVRTLLLEAGFRDVQTQRDLAGHERVTEGRWPPSISQPRS